MVRFNGCDPLPLITVFCLLSILSFPGCGAMFLGAVEPVSCSRFIGGLLFTAANDGERFTGVKPPGRFTAVKPGVGRIGISVVGVLCSWAASGSDEALTMLEARMAGDSWGTLDGVEETGRFATGDRFGDGV